MSAPDEWLIRDYERTVGNLRRDLTAAQLKASVLLGAVKAIANGTGYYAAEARQIAEAALAAIGEKVG